jgi:hypothetical protein
MEKSSCHFGHPLPQCQCCSRDKHVQTAVAKVEDMKVVMGRNLNLLMERGENSDSGQQIQFLREGGIFQERRSTRMRKQMRRKVHRVWNYSTAHCAGTHFFGSRWIL